jgi:hypothetical protein
VYVVSFPELFETGLCNGRLGRATCTVHLISAHTSQEGIERAYCPDVYTVPAFLWSWLAIVLLLLLLLTALLSLEGVSLVDGLLPSEAGSEYMGGGGCRLKVKFV